MEISAKNPLQQKPIRQSFGAKLAVAKILLLNAAAEHGSAAVGDALKKDTVTQLCKLEVHYKAAAESVIHATSSSTGSLDGINLLKARVDAAATTADEQTAAKLKLLVKFLEQKMSQLTTRATATAANATKAAAASAFFAGKLAQTLEVFHAAKDGTGNLGNCIHTGSGTDGAAPLTAVLEGCGVQPNFDSPKTQVPDSHKHVTLTAPKISGLGASGGSADSSCHLTKGAARGILTTSPISGTVKWSANSATVTSGAITLKAVNTVNVVTGAGAKHDHSAAIKNYREFHGHSGSTVVVPTETNYDQWRHDPLLDKVLT
uniref:Variant surface glycoprotein n=1 Tax=Trypanosoma brucei TaxID=5691 RepID=A0A1V0FYD0_9TRYP|nr:variant surface glycoprotein [Trypanosoma brucei]